MTLLLMTSLSVLLGMGNFMLGEFQTYGKEGLSKIRRVKDERGRRLN